MDELEVTWTRALKLWWSYTWRGVVLMLLLVIPLQILLFAFVLPSFKAAVETHPGQPPNFVQLQHMGGLFSLIWLIGTIGMIALQVQGMRWMVRKARWSDFRIAMLAANKGN